MYFHFSQYVFQNISIWLPPQNSFREVDNFNCYYYMNRFLRGINVGDKSDQCKFTGSRTPPHIKHTMTKMVEGQESRLKKMASKPVSNCVETANRFSALPQRKTDLSVVQQLLLRSPQKAIGNGNASQTALVWPTGQVNYFYQAKFGLRNPLRESEEK